MSRTLKRSAAFAAATLSAVTISAAGAGTAGANAVEWEHRNGSICYAGFNDQAHFDLGILHASEASRYCANLAPGTGSKGEGMSNTVILGTVPLPNGKLGMAWLDDPTGLYPVR